MPPHSTCRSIRQSLANAADVTVITPRAHFSGLQTLQRFVELAGFNRAIGDAVEELGISLPTEEGYPAETVRCLQLTPNVGTLILDLPPSSPLSVFNDVAFPKLTVFATNLPHRLLPSFLQSHSTIDVLILRACGRSARCPLQGLELHELTNLQCPSRCFAGIIRGRLTTATINLTHLGSLARVGLRSLSATSLNTLTVDFYPDDYDILRLVVAVTPHLQHLKLNEKLFCQTP